MTDTSASLTNKPVWVDLATSDPQAARDFYSQLLGWQVEVNPDPQYGGYGIAKLGGNDVAGIGGKQSDEQPTVWALYIGSDNLEALSQRVTEAGGNVIVPAFDVGDQGRMAVFQDAAGAFISAWQATTMRGFGAGAEGAFGWAELNARGVESAVRFYEQVFGWTAKESSTGGGGDGRPPYIEFHKDDESILGALEIPPELPPGMPSYWLIYFSVSDVEGAARKAVELGGREVVPAQDFSGGSFAIVTDPQGATFGLLNYTGD
jgi:uncharacterized protein